jgi:hypothetical protein
MTTPVGGIRYRLIKDNLEMMLRDSLDSIGWFNSGRKHAPVSIIGESVNPHVEIKPNIISISTENMETTEWEMGSGLEEHRWDVYLDIFAESNAMGLHLAGDIQDVLKGKMPSIDRDRPILDVFDIRMATPVKIFTCQLENVQMARVRNWTDPWNEHWWALLVEVVDYYDSESD